jgi:hypothetical protein
MGKTGQTILDHCLPCFSHCIVSPSLIYAMITPLDHCLTCFAHCIVSPSSIYAMITPLDHCLPCFSHCIVSPYHGINRRRTDNTMDKTGQTMI